MPDNTLPTIPEALAEQPERTTALRDDGLTPEEVALLEAHLAKSDTVTLPRYVFDAMLDARNGKAKP